MATIGGALEFDDNQAAVAVHAQEIDASPGIGEGAKFFRYDHDTVDDHVYAGS
ncbi:hypothetical protein GCM10010435_46260 [Winogradskya consettensis]